MRTKYSVAAALIAAILLFFLTPAIAVGNGNIVKIGFYPMAGLQNVGKDGTLSGYNYDYLQEISKITGWYYEYYRGDFADCLEKLKSGEIDFMGGMQKTEERKEFFDFPEYSCGEMCVELLVKGDNIKYAYDDTESFKGMRVGVIKGLAGNVDFEKYCRDNNFSTEIIEYSGIPEIIPALKSGDLDAFVSLSTLPRKDLRCIAAFGYKNFYFMSSNKRPELIQQMNRALAQIKTLNPFFEQELKTRYFPTQKNSVPVFTKKELDYIQRSRTFNVIYNKNLPPMDYYDEETGSFDGIIADVFALISKLSGLKFNYIPVEDYEKAYKMLANHEAHIKSSAPNDYIWAAGNNIKLSHEYLTVPAVMISGKRNENSGRIVVAMPERLHLSTQIQKDLPNYEYKKYADYGECFEAIFKGEADATFANTYIASKYLKKQKYSGMSILAVNDYITGHCIAFAGDTDRTLITIIDKTLACISKEQINEFVIAHTVACIPTTITDLFYRFPVVIIFSISSLLGFFVFLFMSLHNKTRLAQKFYEIANTDEVTGGDSYAKFCREADALLENPERPPYALAYFDVMKFDEITLLYGLNTANTVLRTISEVVRRHLDPGELLARQDSDHFVVLFISYDKATLEKRYAELVKYMSELFFNNRLPCKPRLRFGIYYLTDRDRDIAICRDRARHAHVQCGPQVTCGYVVYDASIGRKVQIENDLEFMMEGALASGEFKVYYQPKMDSKSNIILGAEALVRWQSPKYGMLSPAAFLPLFERNTFILKIDYYVFKEVCRFIADRKKSGKLLFPIAVNFSRLHFLEDNFADKLAGIADSFELEHSLLSLEITESIAIGDIELLRFQMNKLRSKGFNLSLDDFGSGYSSLGIMSEIKFEEIKLDRSLIINASLSEEGRLLLAGLVSMLKSLNKVIICEGVESLEQVEMLQNIGCYAIQGYFYSRPIPEYDFGSRY